MTRTRTIYLALIVVLLSPMVANADLIELEATLDGAQALAGVGFATPGTGSATLTFDDVTNLFSWDITWSGLLGSVIAAHFHGAALPTQNAAVQVDIGAISTLISPVIGSTTISNDQAGDLLAGLWYINIHTDVSLPGEIRGQVRRVYGVPEPPSLVLLGIGLAGLGLTRRSKKV